MTNTPFSLDVSFAFIIPGQYLGSQVVHYFFKYVHVQENFQNIH